MFGIIEPVSMHPKREDVEVGKREWGCGKSLRASSLAIVACPLSFDFRPLSFSCRPLAFRGTDDGEPLGWGTTKTNSLA